ncbi:chitin-binding type-2 domain-containing protein [Caerostris extrusa]|uniref:Chitin-binding type-2 domain-containing protein n=1 Tax=Caerostris extrusa TaxID=172846 RepID=A0AAV4PCH3_CAEEX|nr:chitin-binding type-2 domain-containing protein [Caerostris extrusa]
MYDIMRRDANNRELIWFGILCIQFSECQSYNGGGARGDEGDQALGFDSVLQRHDGYVKGETPTIPQTSFSCSAQPYNPGLYADVETQCQVYHVCFEDRQESFLCGPGTNFNQRILACDFWYNFDCNESPSFYNVNADIGKVPDTIFKPGQSRVPGSQQPSYPNYPRQPDQPPSIGSYPPRVSIPPPSRNDPQPPIQRPETPVFQPQPPIQRPETPVFQPQPQPPRIQPQPPRIQPQPQPPRIQPQPQPQPPRIQPQPPRIQPQPQPPRIQPQPQPPRFQPQPQPPRIQPQPPSYPQPGTTNVGVKPQYPSTGSGHGSGGRIPQQPYPPSIQQEEDTGYQFDGYKPPKPVSLPLPPPPPPKTPRPSFPPVISPPRVARPPLTPAIVRRPEGTISIPRVPVTQTEYHPDANLKGNVGYQPPRVPQPSRPVGTGYPSYPVSPRPVSPRPVPQKPIGRPSYVPPSTVQQEHVDTEYVPPPPPYPPKQPSKPSTSYVPPPIQQEARLRSSTFSTPRPAYVPPPSPPSPPSRPAYVPPPPPPPPVAQKPIEPNYGKPHQPAPSIVKEHQKPAGRQPSRPQVTGGGRQPTVRPPQRPKPIFPPASDHPNSNIKGGPGYNQPPPQIPRFEPTRVSRPSTPQGGYVQPKPVQQPIVRPDVSISGVKPTGEKRPSISTSTGYKPPQQDRIKKPSEPSRGVYQPPIQVIDHPQREIKGADYRDPVPHQPQRIKSPSTSVSGVKLPQGSGYPQPQVQRPRAPVVVSRPQPPSIPAAVKRPTPVDSQLYEKTRPRPPAPQPGRIKQPSQIQGVSRPSEPRFPSHQPVDHPNANVKGGVYNQPRPQSPPSSPSTAYEQKTTSTNQKRPIATGYPSPVSNPSRGNNEYVQQVVQQRPQTKTVSTSGVKTTGGYQPQSASQLGLPSRVPKPDYDAGTSYTRGPDVYPKPEFGQPNAPYQPVSTPSRSTQIIKPGSPSQNAITSSQVKPAYQGSQTSSGYGTQVRPDYENRQLPGHQPPNQPQVFPHRENPDHPNESLKGSGAYRPPPPAGFQAAASEVKEQKILPEPEPEPAATSLHGDTGAE